VALVILDRDRNVVQTDCAGAFARRGADAAGEFRKVIGFAQSLPGFEVEAAVRQVVEFRDQIMDRAAGCRSLDEEAGVAERNAAVHAAGALYALFCIGQAFMELIKVSYPLQGFPISRKLSLVFKKSSGFAHLRAPSAQLPLMRDASFVLFSNAAISASSPDRPAASTAAIDASIR